MRAVAALALLLTAPAWAGPKTYQLPEETASLRPGPGLELAQQNCVACHSADYISTQPRALRDPRGFWRAEVTKMTSAYGAPIDPADVPKIVDYLAAAYGQ